MATALWWEHVAESIGEYFSILATPTPMSPMKAKRMVDALLRLPQSLLSVSSEFETLDLPSSRYMIEEIMGVICQISHSKTAIDALLSQRYTKAETFGPRQELQRSVAIASRELEAFCEWLSQPRTEEPVDFPIGSRAGGSKIEIPRTPQHEYAAVSPPVTISKASTSISPSVTATAKSTAGNNFSFTQNLLVAADTAARLAAATVNANGMTATEDTVGLVRYTPPLAQLLQHRQNVLHLDAMLKSESCRTISAPTSFDFLRNSSGTVKSNIAQQQNKLVHHSNSVLNSGMMNDTPSDAGVVESELQLEPCTSVGGDVPQGRIQNIVFGVLLKGQPSPGELLVQSGLNLDLHLHATHMELSLPVYSDEDPSDLKHILANSNEELEHLPLRINYECLVCVSLPFLLEFTPAGDELALRTSLLVFHVRRPDRKNDRPLYCSFWLEAASHEERSVLIEEVSDRFSSVTQRALPNAQLQLSEISDWQVESQRKHARLWTDVVSLPTNHRNGVREAMQRQVSEDATPAKLERARRRMQQAEQELARWNLTRARRHQNESQPPVAQAEKEMKEWENRKGVKGWRWGAAKISCLRDKMLGALVHTDPTGENQRHQGKGCGGRISESISATPPPPSASLPTVLPPPPSMPPPPPPPPPPPSENFGESFAAAYARLQVKRTTLDSDLRQHIALHENGRSSAEHACSTGVESKDRKESEATDLLISMPTPLSFPTMHEENGIAGLSRKSATCAETQSNGDLCSSIEILDTNIHNWTPFKRGTAPQPQLRNLLEWQIQEEHLYCGSKDYHPQYSTRPFTRLATPPAPPAAKLAIARATAAHGSLSDRDKQETPWWMKPSEGAVPI